MKVILVIVISLTLIACGPISYDIKHDRSHWGPGNLGWLTQKKDTPVSLTTHKCCKKEDVDFWLINGKNPLGGVTDKIFAPTGNIVAITAVKEQAFGSLGTIPTHFIAFNFKAEEPMDLKLEGSVDSGYRFLDRKRSFSFEGKIFNPDELYEAYQYLSVNLSKEDIDYIQPAKSEILYDESIEPKPIFGINPSVSFTKNGKVKLTYDLDVSGKPININAVDQIEHLSELAVFTLKTMRFQKTFVNKKFIERRNLDFTFDYSFEIQTRY